MTEKDQKNEALFMQLIFTFQTAAWQQMGKIKNPLTDKVERDIDQARFSIDMLDMIRTKTQGNLSENEKMYLDKVISELQLNFVAEVDKEQKEKEQGEEKKEDKTQEESRKEEKKEETSGDTEKTARKEPKKRAKKQPKKK